MSEVPGIKLLHDTDVQRSEGASRLFVYVHGYTRIPEVDTAVARLVRDLWGEDVDLLLPRHKGGALSNNDPFELAKELEALIAARVDEKDQDGVGSSNIVDVGLLGLREAESDRLGEGRHQGGDATMILKSDEKVTPEIEEDAK